MVFFVYAIDMMICAAALYALSKGVGRISRIFESDILVNGGNISMNIFLTHYLIRMYVDFVVRYFDLQSVTVAIVEVIIILGLTFSISLLIEKYYRRKGEQ